MKQRLLLLVVLLCSSAVASCGGGAEEQSYAGEPEITEEASAEVTDSSEQPTTEIEKIAKETMEANPDLDWSRGYTPMGDGTVVPFAEVEAKMGKAMQEGLEQFAGALDAAGNPANDKPKSKDAAARNKCLEAEYEGLPIQQKTERSREINSEAKARGIEAADVVGC